MTRTIPAANVIPGQRIRWTERGTTREITVTRTRQVGCTDTSTQFRNDAGCYEYTDPETKVTVLAEGPQEPTWFGARAVTGEYLGVRASENPDYPWTVRKADNGDLAAVTWAWLCERGPVTVLPDTLWAVPTGSRRVWDRWGDVPQDVIVTPRDVTWRVRRTAGCDQYQAHPDDPWMTAPFWIADINGPFTEVAP